MTDNFRIIREMIRSQWDGQFDSLTDLFYTIEIIGRSKDSASIKSHKFKTYYIRTIEDFDKYENEITLLCDTLNMRAYISVNAKSWRKVTLNTMAEYADRIARDDFSKPHSVFDSCASKFADKSSQLWIIDVDKEDADLLGMSVDDLTVYYGTIIEKECDPRKPVVEVIPTKSGAHIITHPFNIVEFANKACRRKTVEELIKKNGLTLLYENIQHS